jgi:hypothetical protein
MTPAVRELWLFVRDGVPELWVVTDQISAEHERELIESSLMLFDEFPDALHSIRIVTPHYYPGEFNLRSSLPKASIHVDLFRS